jgi:hypothetical protein
MVLYVNVGRGLLYLLNMLGTLKELFLGHQYLAMLMTWQRHARIGFRLGAGVGRFVTVGSNHHD